MQLIRSQKSRQAIEASLLDPQWRMLVELPFGEHGRAYYRAVAGPGLDDQTFGFEDAGRMVALVECSAADGAVAHFGFAIEPRILPDLPYAQRQQLAVDIVSELRSIAAACGAQAVRVRSTPQNDGDGLLLGQLADAGAAIQPELRAVVDLGHSDEALLADLRAGHRRHLRWSEANMTLRFVDTASPDRAAFEAYRALHAEVAGRVTRSAESWEAMFGALAQGAGDLVLGQWQGQLVSGTLVLDGVRTAYYASGAYRRELFDKPLSHGTMFEAIKRARRRGRAAFDVGELPSRESGASDKEVAIGHFKRGFSSMTLSSLIATWRPGNP
jgi:hypothetical protein